MSEKPVMLENPDFSVLKDVCQAYIDALASDDEFVDDDFDHYIFENALGALFGKDVWKFVNSHLRG